MNDKILFFKYFQYAKLFLTFMEFFTFSSSRINADLMDLQTLLIE